MDVTATPNLLHSGISGCSASANGTSERLKSKHDGGDRNGVEPPAKRRHLEAEPLEDYSKTGINVAEPTTVRLSIRRRGREGGAGTGHT